MLFALSIIILVVTVLLLAPLFLLERKSDIVLGWALFSYASLVLVFQAANLFHRINQVGVILVLQGILLVGSAALWFLRGRPPLFPEFGPFPGIKPLLQDRQNWPVLILLAALVSALGMYVILIYVVPPNNNDALSIHLARVLKWKQLGSYFPWNTPNICQVEHFFRFIRLSR